jgi:hypothetical protein
VDGATTGMVDPAEVMAAIRSPVSTVSTDVYGRGRGRGRNFVRQNALQEIEGDRATLQRAAQTLEWWTHQKNSSDKLIGISSFYWQTIISNLDTTTVVLTMGVESESAENEMGNGISAEK